MELAIEKFQEIKSQVRLAEKIHKDIEELDTKISNLHKMISLIENPELRLKEDRCMLMVGMNTLETGRYQFPLDDVIFRGIADGLRISINIYEDKLNKLKIDFNDLISVN